MAFFLPDEHIQSFDEPASCLHTANLPLISTASRLLPSILRSALTDNRLFCPVTTTSWSNLVSSASSIFPRFISESPIVISRSCVTLWTFRANTLYHIIDGMRIKTFGYIYQRDTLRFKTICLLAPLAIEVNMLVGNGVMCVAITQLIFERAAAILYHMHYFFFRKKFKHSENTRFLHWKIQQDFP